jgi:ketosteroid isomerase-like protein
MNKASWFVRSSAGLLISGLFACAAPAANPERAALEAAIHRWTTAVNAQDVATLTVTMTEDVELMDDTGSVTGRDAAIRTLREAVTRGPLAASSRELTIAHDVAWRVVGLVQTRKSGDVHARGQSLEIWKRVNGSWQLHRRMVAGAAEVSLTRPSIKEPVLDRPKN